MTAVATALRKRNIGERLLIRNIVCVHAITNHVVRKHIEAAYEHSCYDPSRDIGHVIGNAAAVRESRCIPG